MLLERLELENFRSYEGLRADLPPGLNLLVGENAQGKTSFLEALYLLSSSRSFRVARDEELVRWGAGGARVSAWFRRDEGASRHLEMAWNRSAGGELQREVRRNRLPVRKLAEFLGEVPLALFVPTDLELVQGGPQGRRRYLDLLLCKLHPAYLSALSRLQQALRQRSELLRRWPAPAEAELEPWDLQVAAHGAVVARRREQACHHLHEVASDMFGRLSASQAALQLAYQPAGPLDEEHLARALEERRREDLRRGTTSVGPHRDELDLRLDGRSLRRFGSQGQQRSAALALRLAEARVLAEVGGEGSMVLLDDCFSELDPGRRRRLVEILGEWPQVFVTTTSLPEDAPSCATVLTVHAGSIGRA